MLEQEYYNNKLAEIPKDVLEKAIEYLNQHLSEDDKEFLINEYNKNRLLIDWFIPYHNYDGMYLRNELRNIGLTDDLLPDKNWDDYYIQVLELAIGIREGDYNE